MLLLLAGCEFAYNNNPLLDTVGALIPGTGDVSAEAERIPYASLRFSIAGRGGLIVLAEQADGATFWQSGQRETVVLRDGYFVSTSGMPNALEMTELTLPSSGDDSMPWTAAPGMRRDYRVTRAWKLEDGSTQSAAAEATMVCHADIESQELTLRTMGLQRCDERLSWPDGQTTYSTYWRSPDNRRIWKARTTAWPDGPSVEWDVARRWW